MQVVKSLPVGMGVGIVLLVSAFACALGQQPTWALSLLGLALGVVVPVLIHNAQSQRQADQADQARETELLETLKKFKDEPQADKRTPLFEFLERKRNRGVEKIDLTGVNLGLADLREAPLRGTLLSYLGGANLRGADLRGAVFVTVHGRSASLFRAKLRGADLRGADLSEADLREANVAEAYGDETTILPRGKEVSWENKPDPAKEGA